MRVEFKRLENGQDVELPTYETLHSAGMDIRAAEDGVVIRGGTVMVRTGFALAIPAGYEVQIRSRSGLAKKHGVFVTNAPGTIDSDYRGEICVLLTCVGPASFQFKKGDRIAQMVLAPVVLMELSVVYELDSTARGTGGFGSTGK